MSVEKNSVLLLKSQKSGEETDKYEELLTQNGYTVRQIKTLIFEYKNLNVLFEKLKRPNDYRGIIFSSPRCVTGVCLALQDCDLDAEWKIKENFVVGETTFEIVKTKLGLICKGSETGNACNLAELIKKDTNGPSKPFLFPHGNLKTDTLKNNGLNLDEVLVYETIANPCLQQEFISVTNNYLTLPEFFVFFSPSGVDSTLDFIKKVPVDWALLKFIAIGPVTEEKMKERGIPVNAVADKPNANCVLKVIAQLKNK